MVEWGRLLSGYWGEILSRRFESCHPRHCITAKTRSMRDAFLFCCVVVYPAIRVIYLIENNL